MLEILRNLQKSAPISFSLVAVNLDQKQPWFPEHILPAYLEQLGLNTRLSKRTPTASSKRRSRKEKPPARCALACVAASSIVPPPSSGRPRSPRPSSRRYPADAVFEYVLRRQNERDAAEADERRRQTHRHPPAGLLPRKGHRALLPCQRLPDYSVQPVRFAAKPAAPVIADMLRDWDKRYPGALKPCSARCRTWYLRT